MTESYVSRSVWGRMLARVEEIMAVYGSRDVPVRWETVRENAFNDPSHDNVLHHGYFIANRSNAQVWPPPRLPWTFIIQPPKIKMKCVV